MRNRPGLGPWTIQCKRKHTMLKLHAVERTMRVLKRNQEEDFVIKGVLCAWKSIPME